jgi:Flp pilus assembly protein TadG
MVHSGAFWCAGTFFIQKGRLMKFGKRMFDRLTRSFVCDEGSAAVSFILTFPIFMTIVAVIVQLSLMVNARIMVAAAADAAARAAMTSLPDEHPENVTAAAVLALTPLSPEATEASTDGSAYAAAMNKVGVTVPETFAARYAFAAAATDVSWTPQPDFVKSKGSEIEVTVNYRFPLTVPVAMRMITAVDTTLGGITGRFWEVSGKSRVQVSHGRKARTNGDGWPE